MPAARAPDQYRRLTHAHAAATGGTRQGAPAPFFTTASNGPNSYGDGRRHATATVHLRPRPHPPDPGKNPGRPRPETRQRRKGTQFSSHHGRAAKRRMYSCTGTTDPADLAQIAGTLSQDAVAGRLGQVTGRWIYTACLIFGLDLADQRRTCFAYAYSVYQAEYSRNLLFAYGGHMDRVFNAMLDRTRSRLAGPGPVPPGHPGPADLVRGPPPSRQVRHPPLAPGRGRARETCVGPDCVQSPLRPADTQGLHQRRARPPVRSDQLQHQAAGLRPGTGPLPQIVARLAGICQRFCTALDCDDIGFIPGGTLDQLPLPAQLGASRVGGIDVNKPRIRAALAAVLALAPSPDGFTVADMTAKVHAMTGQDHATYNTRQAAYDLRKLRGKQLIRKPSGSAATICPARPPGPYRRCSPSGITSLPRPWPTSRSAGTTTSRPG